MKYRSTSFLPAILFLYILITTIQHTSAQTGQNFEWNKLPVKALLLTVPHPEDVPEFCRFIKEVLPKEGVNTLVLRIRYSYQFKSHPELAGERAISEQQLKQIVQSCKEAKIRFIPKMNLLGHQSDQDHIDPLLAKYPQFDESPDYNPPIPWKNAGPFDFYCKSLCPSHPDLLKTIFPLMDELIDVCGADAFHVGLDEVWILGYDKCPRCGGRDKAALFAEYATKLHDHLKEKKCQMWMWSDRLIDGKTTNLLGWQASMNATFRAIDLIPTDIMICDWKYESAPPTPGYFAIKGFNVLPSSCSNSEVALAQLAQVRLARKDGTRAPWAVTLAERMQGVFVTMWEDSKEFIDAYYGRNGKKLNSAETFKAVFAQIRKDEAMK